MKKYILITLAVLGLSSTANAGGAWDKKKAPVTISYIHKKVNIDNNIHGFSDEDRSGHGFAITKYRTYNLGKPIGGVLRFGIDATWADFRYVCYKRGKGIKQAQSLLGVDNSASTSGETYVDMEEYFNAASQTTALGDMEVDLKRLNLGQHEFGYYMGVGPSLQIAPMGASKSFKISAYAHWKPGVEAFGYTDGKSPAVHFAPVLKNFAVGGSLSYNRFGIGVEHSFGEVDYKAYHVDSEEKFVKSSTSCTAKLGTTRVFFGFKF